MELNDYQKRAMGTCMPASNNFSYMFLNLVGEVGEFASKVAKAIRKDNATIMENHITLWEQQCGKDLVFREEMRKEAGDILWQLSGLCKVMGWSLEEVAVENLEKLASRQERGKIDGEGDNR